MDWDTLIGGGGVVITLLGALYKISSDQAKTRNMVDNHEKLAEERGERLDNMERGMADLRERVARDYVTHFALSALEARMERGFESLRQDIKQDHQRALQGVTEMLEKLLRKNG